MAANQSIRVVVPKWECPPDVLALTTTRGGGESKPPFDALNLAAHVGDHAGRVRANRRHLQRQCQLPQAPVWLRQVHGTHIVHAHQVEPGIEADGAITSEPGVVCAVLTADCLPLFVCSRSGDTVGVFHVGWRGLAAGIVEAAVETFSCPGRDLLAALGPAIGPRKFEIGDEVRNALRTKAIDSALGFTRSDRAGKWYADLYALVMARLQRLGVASWCDPGICTFSQPHEFFSYRRQPRCGRMASLIWRTTDECR